MSDYKLTKDRYIVVSLEKTSTMAEACGDSAFAATPYDPEPEFMHTACLFECAEGNEYGGRVLSGISAYDAETLLKLMRQWL